jgi:hypothetical protein
MPPTCPKCRSDLVVHRSGDIGSPRSSAARYWVTSCDLRILMDQPTETIVPDRPLGGGRDGWLVAAVAPARTPNGAMAVVVAHMLANYPARCARPTIGIRSLHLTAHGAHPPLRVGVRARCRTGVTST